MIKDLFIRQKQFFSNLSLKKKFMSIIIALLFLMLAGFGIGMLLVRRSDDLLLYNSTRGTVVYSAQVLSDRLQTVENMTRIMLGDSVLQENLAIADDPDATHGLLVYAAVCKKKESGVDIDGGRGVGRVTKKGLEQPVGAAACRAPRTGRQ